MHGSRKTNLSVTECMMPVATNYFCGLAGVVEICEMSDEILSSVCFVVSLQSVQCVSYFIFYTSTFL